MMSEPSTIQILFVSEAPETQYGIKSVLAETSYSVHVSQSKIRAFQLLSVEQFTLVVADLKIPKTSGIAFCKTLRSEKRFRNIPIILVGEDDAQGTHCVSALEAGADDFVSYPFVPAVFIARANRFLKKKTSPVARSFLSVQVSSGDLPGILQYLEAEIKTGKLNIKGSDDSKAEIYFKEGRLVNAMAPYCDGLDAVTEVLSWDSSHVTFHDLELTESDEKFNYETTGTIMNCVVDVDEFREIKKSMPSNDVMFQPGEKSPEEEMQFGQKKIYEFGVIGYSLEDLLTMQKVSARKATIWLHQLIDEGYLKTAPPPFKNYTLRSYQTYKGSQVFSKRFQNISETLSEIEFPIPDPKSNLPFGANDWVTAAPKIVITGDHFDNVSLFVQSLSKLASHTSKTKPLVKKHVKGIVTTRLFFKNKEIIDIQQLPPAFDKLILNTIQEFLTDVHAVIFVITSQDKKSNQDNLRILRILRQQFLGIYYFIVPQVPNKNNISEFRIDCSNCNFRLAVDMKMAGAIGECPICRASLTIPDCLDHLAHSLKLPNDVPIAQLQPHAINQCRDLLKIVFDSILTASNPPEFPVEKEVAPEVEKQDLNHSQVRGRKNQTHEPITQVDSVSDEVVKAKPRKPSKTEKAHPKPQEVQENPGLTLDDLLNTDEDQFDIDEFIRSVRGAR